MTSRPRAALLVLAYLAFISLGLPDGLLGVAWPAIRGDFAVATSAVGLVLTTTTIGFLASSVAAGFALSRLGVGWLLAASTGLVAFALIGYAVAPTFAPMVGFGLLLGIGSGAIDSGLNAYAASAFGPRHMNWLHAFFGLGVALGPLTMTAVLSLGFAWRWGYVLVAAAQLALAVAFASSHAAWSRGPRVAVGTSPPARRTLALPAVWFGALAFVVYTGVEVGAGLWAYLLLTEGRGLAGTVAGICVSAYWASLFIGRLVLGEVSERLGPPRVLPASLAGMVAGAALVAMPTAVSAVAGLVLIGFAEAPVFPLLTLTTADRVGVEHADRAIGVQVASAALGVALLPSVIGVVITDGVNRLGPSLFVLTLLLCALYVGVTRFARHGDRAAETAH